MCLIPLLVSRATCAKPDTKNANELGDSGGVSAKMVRTRFDSILLDSSSMFDIAV